MRRLLLLIAAVVTVTANPEAMCSGGVITRFPLAVILGNASIAGQVVDLNGRPIRDAEVSVALFEAGHSPASTTTGADGGFRFADLPAGRHLAGARKKFYLPGLHGADGPGALGRLIQIREHSSTSGIRIVLRPAGAVEGRVTDEYGDPVFEARVTLARGPLDLPELSAITNDEGRFRIADVLPGSYVLCVKAPSDRVPSTFDTPHGNRNTTTVYATECYGTTGAENAQRFQVRGGDTVHNIDVELRPVPIWNVSGTALDSRGRPITNQRVWARRAGDPHATLPHTTTDAEGRFTLQSLPSGDYALSVTDDTRPERRVGSGCDVVLVSADESAAIVHVDQGHVVGVVLAPTDVVPLDGRMFFDDDRTPRPQHLRVALKNVGSAWQMIQPREPAAISADGTFFIRAEPAVVAVNVVIGDGRWFTKAVRFNGRDVTGQSIDLGSSSGGRLEIELTTAPGEVTGRAVSADGRPAYGRVMAVQRDPLPRGIDPYAVATDIGRGGTFSLKSLPPGEYELIGVHDLSWADVRYAGDLAGTGTRITVKAGERVTADVRLDLLP